MRLYMQVRASCHVGLSVLVVKVKRRNVDLRRYLGPLLAVQLPVCHRSISRRAQAEC